MEKIGTSTVCQPVATSHSSIQKQLNQQTQWRCWFCSCCWRKEGSLHLEVYIRSSLWHMFALGPSRSHFCPLSGERLAGCFTLEHSLTEALTNPEWSLPTQHQCWWLTTPPEQWMSRIRPFLIYCKEMPWIRYSAGDFAEMRKACCFEPSQPHTLQTGCYHYAATLKTSGLSHVNSGWDTFNVGIPNLLAQMFIRNKPFYQVFRFSRCPKCETLNTCLHQQKRLGVGAIAGNSINFCNQAFVKYPGSCCSLPHSCPKGTICPTASPLPDRASNAGASALMMRPGATFVTSDEEFQRIQKRTLHRQEAPKTVRAVGGQCTKYNQQ